MSENKVNKAVVCPMCGELGKAEIYTSVNVARHKSYREKVLDGELFSWTCPSCAYNARLTYPILYNDMKNRFMVYLIPKIERFQLCDKELEEKYSNLRNISKRVVSDFNSFKEKIFIFESRLDDMYDRESNTMGFTYFTGDDRTPYVQTARLEIYGKSKDIIERFAIKDKKLKGFIKIDREWAENILYRYKRAKQIEKLNKLKE